MAFKNDYLLNVDIKKSVASIVPNFRQGDSARIQFRVFDNGKLFDLSEYTRSEITFQLPSAKIHLGDCNLNDGLIEYVFTGIEMSEQGSVEVTVSIYSGETTVSIRPFKIFIYGNIGKEEVTYIGMLQELIASTQELGEIANDNAQEALDLLEQANEINQLIMDEEVTRTVNESTRLSNEDERIFNENERIQDEGVREDNESLRISRENARVSSESTRISNENQRQVNESNRVINTGLAIDKINTAVNNFDHRGTFSSSVTYVKNNIVTYNGSSHMALKNVTGITPNDDGVNWRLVAQRGVDGTGSVSKVNNLSPDANGNITIPNATISQSGLLSPSEKEKLIGISEGATNTTVVNSLTSTSTTSAVSAAQAKALKDTIDTHKNNTDANNKHVAFLDTLPSSFNSFGLMVKIDGTVSNVPPST